MGCRPTLHLWLLVLASCVASGERGRIQAIVDADRAVRELTVKVDVLIEEEDPKTQMWFEIADRTFRPDKAMPWPLSLVVPLSDIPYPGRFQLTATARDANDAVVAQARAIRTMPNRSAITTLRTHFDAQCLHRAELCGDRMTCDAGACVNAEGRSKDTDDDDDEDESAPADTDGIISIDQASTARMATIDAPCATESATACSDAKDAAPLVCDGGHWRAGDPCAENERCAPSDGKCRGVAPECVGRSTTERFCDEDVMLVCSDGFSPVARACGANERCVAEGGEVRCDCSIGYVRDGTSCRAATSCDTKNGGCDPLTTCSADAKGVSCSACPSGYAGDGKTGCRPLLTALDVQGGSVTPALSADVREYRVKLPLLIAQASLSAAGPAGTRVEIDTHAVPDGTRWLSPVLSLGETIVEVTLISEAGVRSTYRIRLERAGAEVAYLKTSNPSAYDYFGINVSRDGNTIVVSAPREDGNANRVNGTSDGQLTDSGAAYVFVTDGTRWTQQAYLKPTDTSAGALFGGQVGISKDTIAVGAVRTDVTGSGTPRTGVAYAFERQNGNWSQTASLRASDGVAGDLFGYSIVVDPESILVSAPRAGGGSGAVGVVYVFAKQNGTWTVVQKLRPSTAAAGSSFGSSMWLYPNMLFVGAEDELEGAGAMYVFVKQNGTWVEQQRLAGDPMRGDRTFGWSVAMSGDFLAIGASGASEPTPVSPPGSVYLYKRSSDRWIANGAFRAPNPRTSDYFGAILCVTDHVLAIGASGDSSSSRGLGGDPQRTDARFAGAVYLYPRADLATTAPVYLKASNADSLDGFGYAMTCSENELVVTAPFEASGASGIDGDRADNSATSAGAAYVIR